MRKTPRLFFLMDFASEEWKPKVEAAVRLMCDEGIGGYRSVGKGWLRATRIRRRIGVHTGETGRLDFTFALPSGP